MNFDQKCTFFGANAFQKDKLAEKNKTDVFTRIITAEIKNIHFV